MKTIKKLLKAMLLIMMLMISATFHGQSETKNKHSFVRVYNLEGKKINKGFVVKVSDTTLIIKRNNKLSELNWDEIGFIKTKRSGGNNILIGSLIGASAGAILGGVTTQDSDYKVFSLYVGRRSSSWWYLWKCIRSCNRSVNNSI